MDRPEEHDKFMAYLEETHRLDQCGRVINCCRILGLKCDEISIESVEQALKTQLISPGVHPKLASEMKTASSDIIQWILENPDWPKIPRF